MISQLSVLVALAACNTLYVKSSTGTSDSSDGSDTPTTDTETTTTDDPPDTTPSTSRLAADLVISKVSLNQGVESVLYEDGDAPNSLEMPIITSRDGLLRVFVDPGGSFENRKIEAVLTIVDNDGSDQLDTQFKVTGKSKDDDLDTTFNFDLSGSQIKQTTEFEVELYEVEDDAPGDGKKKDVTWSSEDFGGLDTESTDELHVKIIPIRYNADGSGRLPDTSPSQLKLIEELTEATYPAQNVVVSADSPYDWDNTISAWSENQWVDILNEMVYYRADAFEAPNTYYYGAFEPEASVNAFCSQGCILGLSYVGYTTAAYWRASVGIGYTGSITSETLIHEMGHAHGREHAPCGLYGQPSDPQYPYSGAALGSWGYDIVSGSLRDPDVYVDMMSYCSPYHISDYNFFALFARMQAVAGVSRAAPTARTTFQLGQGGLVERGRDLPLGDTAGAPRIEVQLVDALGQPAGTTTAAFFPYDHAEGGMIALDQVLPAGWTAVTQPTK